MRPVERPSSMISSSACASASSSSPSPIAATRSARRPRRSSSCTIASTAWVSPSATSAASGASLVMRVVSEDRVQLVLEAAGLDRAMDSALLRRIRLPPPAAGAIGLARLDRARARRAADRRVALVVQRVIRHVVLAHVVPHLVLRPLGQRVELDARAAVDLERGRDADARAEALDRPLEDRLRLFPLELDRQLAGLEIVKELIGAHAPDRLSLPPGAAGLRERLAPLTAPCSPGPYSDVLCPPAWHRQRRLGNMSELTRPPPPRRVGNAPARGRRGAP